MKPVRLVSLPTQDHHSLRLGEAAEACEHALNAQLRIHIEIGGFRGMSREVIQGKRWLKSKVRSGKVRYRV